MNGYILVGVRIGKVGVEWFSVIGWVKEVGVVNEVMVK